VRSKDAMRILLGPVSAQIDLLILYGNDGQSRGVQKFEMIACLPKSISLLSGSVPLAL